MKIRSSQMSKIVECFIFLNLVLEINCICTLVNKIVIVELVEKKSSLLKSFDEDSGVR